MILLSPISNFFITKLNALEFRQRKNKDERVKLMNEILGGIKVLKLNAWEPSFTEHILSIREKELKILKQYALVYSGTSFVWLCAPFLVSYTYKVNGFLKILIFIIHLAGIHCNIRDLHLHWR